MPPLVRVPKKIFTGDFSDILTPGAGDNGKAGVWNHAQQRLEWSAFEAAGSVAAHVGLSNPHTQYAQSSGLGSAAYLNVGTATGNVVQYSAANEITASARVITDVIKPAADSTTALRLTKADGTTAAFTVDTINLEIKIASKLSANSVRAIYVPGGTFSGTMFFGNGGNSLSYVSGNNGRYNVSLGTNALFNLTTGDSNAAIGHDALYSNTTGISNMAIGPFSLRQNVIGNYNAAIGNYAMYTNTGSFNVAIGQNAGYAKVAGNSNVFLGARTGNAASGTLSSNVFVGYESGYNAIGVSGSVLIGNSAGYSESTSNRLHIANLSTKSLILGDFSANTLAFGFTDLTVPTAAGDFAPSTTTRSSIRIRSGVAPTSPNDGDIWYDGSDIKIRVSGTTKTFTLV